MTMILGSVEKGTCGINNSIPVAKHYWKHIYFVFKVGELALLGSKRIAYEYQCVS